MAQRVSGEPKPGCEDISPFPALSGCGSPAQPVRCCSDPGARRPQERLNVRAEALIGAGAQT